MSEAKAANARLRTEREEIAQLEKKPLRRRLLVALGEHPDRSSELARRVHASKESVSRKLAELADAGLVQSVKGEDDRRNVIYSLSPAGRSEMGRHLSLGEAGPVPEPPDRAQFAAFVREAIDGAIALRRRSNSLDEAIDRFQEIFNQCEAAGLPDLALEALAELTTTQRQDRRRKQFQLSLKALERIASGATPADATLVLPAAAHLEYERGRAGDLHPGEEAERVQRLFGARSLFDILVTDRHRADSADWSRRRAWSVASLAGVLRRQTRYEAALEYAALALRAFEDLEDAYGMAHCWFLFGFSLRLLRRFDEAWSCLDLAHQIASEEGNRFERVRANCLMQMGDVERCQGHTAASRERLASAIELAGPMKMRVTQAFAHSAIGAAQFQEGDPELARETLEAAQDLFVRADHREGTALNARRQATVARHLSQAGVKLDTPATKELIRTAQTAYRELAIPTGVAACEIERGWMRSLSPRCGELPPVVKRLGKMVNDMLDDPRRTEVLLLDAWLPAMLQDFARTIAPELLDDAREVYRDAGRKLAEQGEIGMGTINEGGHRIRTDHKTQGSAKVIEMAGESPREREPLALAAA
jgi:DNA-binding MarR family transcriptional regulator